MLKALSTIKHVLRPWRSRVVVALPSGAAAYQFGCDQFDLPTLPVLWGMTGAGLPWWAWIVVAQSGFVYALFEYVRRRLPDEAWSVIPQASNASYDDSAISARVAELEKIKRAIIDDYQRMLGLEARLGEQLDQLKLGLQKDFDEVRMGSQVIERKANEALGVVEKLEHVRVDGAINGRDIEKLTETVKDHRQRAHEAFHALSVLATMPLLESEIAQNASDLTDRLCSGEVYDTQKWQQWENVHSHWRRKLDEWLALGTWYAVAVKERVNSIDEDKYRMPLTIPESSFPNAEAVRCFKKFLIIHVQWEDVVAEVKKGLHQVAYVGLSPLEVRLGRPAG